MPRNNYEPAVTPPDASLPDPAQPDPSQSDSSQPDLSQDDQRCPKCGGPMEPIESGEAGPGVEHLQLCPKCYLVLWRDQDGFQIRQGVPVKQGVPIKSVPAKGAGDPEGC